MDKASERILLGHVTGVSGLKGWVKVHSDTNPRENIFSYKNWWIEQSGRWKQVNVVDGRPQGKTIVARIEGVSTAEQAGQLIGAKIAVDRGSMPKLSADEYYWADLTGMLVRTIEDVQIGPVSRLFETGANDVMVVMDERQQSAEADDVPSAGRSDREVLVPWLVPEVVKEIDMENRTITIDWDPDF